MTLLDTSAWIEFLSGGPHAGRIEGLVKRPQDILTPTIVIYELYKKLKRERGEEAAVSAVAQLEQTRIAALDDAIAVSAADLSLGHDLAMADAVVAATAKAFGAGIVTLDDDFRRVPWAEVLR